MIFILLFDSRTDYRHLNTIRCTPLLNVLLYSGRRALHIFVYTLRSKIQWLHQYFVLMNWTIMPRMHNWILKLMANMLWFVFWIANFQKLTRGDYICQTYKCLTYKHYICIVVPQRWWVSEIYNLIKKWWRNLTKIFNLPKVNFSFLCSTCIQ